MNGNRDEEPQQHQDPSREVQRADLQAFLLNRALAQGLGWQGPATSAPGQLAEERLSTRERDDEMDRARDDEHRAARVCVGVRQGLI